jgi:hypothetical protein
VPITILPEPKSRTKALLSAIADLEDDDLEEYCYTPSSERHGTGARRRHVFP